MDLGIVTPYDVCLGFLIQIHTCDGDLDDTTRINLSFVLLNEIESGFGGVGDDSHPYQSLSSFCDSRLRNDFSTESYASIKHKLNHLFKEVNSPHQVFEVFDKFRCLTTTETTRENNSTAIGTVNRTSAFGIFLRRIVVQFNMLFFGGVTDLFDAIINFVSGHCNSPITQVLSSKSVEMYIDKQVQKLQLESNFPQLPTDQHILEAYTNDPRIHYLKYLRCVGRREWKLAVDHLYRYFDYSQQGTKKSFMAADYAAINLAALHFQFGHHESSLRSIRESIRIAQSKNEQECLAISLSFLFRLADADGMRQHAKALSDRCIKRATELNLSDLLSQSMAWRSKAYLFGDFVPSDDDNRVKMDQVWDDIGGSAHVLLEDNSNKTPSLLANGMTWHDIGCPQISAAYHQCAFVSAVSGSEDSLIACCNMAYHKCEYEGDYIASLELLLNMPCAVELSNSKLMWTKSVISILICYHMNTNCLAHVAVLIKQLELSVNDHHDKGIDGIMMQCQIMYWRSLLCIEGCNYDGAALWANKCIKLCEDNDATGLVAKYLVLLSDVFMDCSSPSSAISYLNKGVAISKENSQEQHLASCLLRLSELAIRTGDFDDCHRYMTQVSQFVKQNGTPCQKCQYHLIMAQAHMEQGSDPVYDLKSARDECVRVQDLKRLEQCLMLEAEYYHSRDDIRNRDGVSEECLRIRKIREERSNLCFLNVSNEAILDKSVWTKEQMKFVIKIV
ncbi:anaphase-promoting complex subunit Apc5 [Acrasis kona]|uniref:Anaphase-promoting complex subunit 5 n=1 Tax=Acrasis kona TaxID=1008807 RepID=A0AAW2ZPC4_9EUKA